MRLRRADDADLPPDPDGVGLPPGAQLPERKGYRRDQLKALMLTNAAALLVVAILWKIGTPYPVALRTCTAIIVFFFFLNLYRYSNARR